MYIHTHIYIYIYIYIYLYIYIYKYICIHKENTYAHTCSHKYAYIIFMISCSNEQLQQQLEDTLLKPDCHSWWISKMQSGREDTLEEWYAKIQYVIAIHLMRWLTNFYDFRFKWTATAAIGRHPTKAWLSQLVNFKNAIWTWGHFRRMICENSVCYCYTSYEMTDQFLWFQVQVNSYSSNWKTPY